MDTHSYHESYNCSIHNSYSIGIVTNLVEVNFLDVAFNLRYGSYRPYKKLNDELKYINFLSNHSPQIL